MKSKFVFLIFFIGYIIIMFSNAAGFIIVGDEILLGLSLSALLMSLGDCVTGIKISMCQSNQMAYITKCTSFFIEDRFKKKVPVSNTGINIRNVKKNLEIQNPTYRKAKHPNEYINTKKIKVCKWVELVFFFLSILSFVVTPFLRISLDTIKALTISTTLLAFGFMCLNLFLSEINEELNKRHIDFINNTQIHISSAYNDFSYWLNNQLNFREDLKAAQEEAERHGTWGIVGMEPIDQENDSDSH